MGTLLRSLKNLKEKIFSKTKPSEVKIKIVNSDLKKIEEIRKISIAGHFRRRRKNYKFVYKSLNRARFGNFQPVRYF